MLSRWCAAGLSERHGRVLRWRSGSVQLLPLSFYSGCIHVSPYFCLSGFIRSIFIITSADLWPQSNWSNSNYITVHLLFFLCCSPAFFSLCPTWSFSPIHSVFVSLSLSIIMFRTLLIALLPWAHILAGHTAFLFMLATYTITLEGGRVCVQKTAELSCIMKRVRLKGVCACLHWCVSVCVWLCVYYMWMNPGIVNKLWCTRFPRTWGSGSRRVFSQRSCFSPETLLNGQINFVDSAVSFFWGD